jgi:putative heme iron utilization protein
MPVPGLEVLRRITEGEANARQLEAQSRQAVEAAAADVDQLVAGQSQTLRELAEHYLPRLSEESARTVWSEMQGTVQELLLRKEDARRQSEQRLQQAIALREACESRWQRACDRANALTKQCDELAQRLAAQLAVDTEFQNLAKRAAEGQARLEQAEASLEEVENEVREYLPSYQKSRLFKYLEQHAYGTSDYKKRGLVRSWDRWVAKLIDYPKALSGYKFLTNTPPQMRQLVAEQRATVQSTIAEVESRQAIAASLLGLPRLQSEGEQSRAEQDEAALAAEKARVAESEARAQIAHCDDEQGTLYREAIETFQNFLKETERSLLSSRATQTPEMTDDQVVARLRHIETDLAEKQKLLADRSRIANLATQRAASFTELVSRFRRAQFDHPRSYLDDEFDVEGQLFAVLDGTTDAERVWQHMRRYQRLGPTLVEKTTDALQHPMTQIMLQTMAQVVGAALGSYASRAGQQNRGYRNNQRDWF